MLYHHCFPLEYAIRKVQEKPGGTENEGDTSVYAADVNLVGNNMTQ
jgi:hypothetical protein